MAVSSATIERNRDNGAVSTMSDRDDDNKLGQDGDIDQPRNKGLFNDFDDDDAFEDSDRDSDFAAIYTEVEEDEEDSPDMETQTWELEEEAPEEDEFEVEEDPWEPSAETEPEEPELWDSTPNPPGAFDDEPPEPEDALPLMADTDPEPLETPEEDWDEFEDDEAFEEEFDEEERELSISLGMIVVAVFALVLLGAGGYGVIEQRAKMQEEIRDLQAKLATSASPREVAETRQAAEEATQRNAALEQQIAELSRENQSLQAIVSGLEKQLVAQQEAIKKAPPPPKVAPKPAPKPAAPRTPTPAASAPVATGSWFVNFSSYSQRSTAESWVRKLQPAEGRVIVASGDSNGRTVYRVRVVDLPDKASADVIARSLEKEYGLSKLWVGKSD